MQLQRGQREAQRQPAPPRRDREAAPPPHGVEGAEPQDLRWEIGIGADENGHPLIDVLLIVARAVSASPGRRRGEVHPV
ncbi:MAG: hypothetical protein ACK559_08605, partial [bacterium]